MPQRSVLLIHGGGVAGWFWRPVMAALARRERSALWRVEAPDLPGHGRLAGGPFVDPLPGLVEHLEQLVAPRMVAGHSFGAQLALRLAASRPDLVDEVVLISAQARPLPGPRWWAAVARWSAPLAGLRWFSRLQAAQLGVAEADFETYFRDTATMSPAVLGEVVRRNVTFTAPGAWADFPGRALVIVGERELSVMRRSADDLHAALPGSSQLVVPGAGHDWPLREPDAVADLLIRVIAAGDPPSSGCRD